VKRVDGGSGVAFALSLLAKISEGIGMRRSGQRQCDSSPVSTFSRCRQSFGPTLTAMILPLGAVLKGGWGVPICRMTEQKLNSANLSYRGRETLQVFPRSLQCLPTWQQRGGQHLIYPSDIKGKSYLYRLK